MSSKDYVRLSFKNQIRSSVKSTISTAITTIAYGTKPCIFVG
jgi:hypothetical protein